MAIIVGVVDEAPLEEDSLDDDCEDAIVDEAPLEEDGLDDDDDDTATEVLDVADVDRTMRDADGSSPMTEVDMMENAAGAGISVEGSGFLAQKTGFAHALEQLGLIKFEASGWMARQLV